MPRRHVGLVLLILAVAGASYGLVSGIMNRDPRFAVGGALKPGHTRGGVWDPSRVWFPSYLMYRYQIGVIHLDYSGPKFVSLHGYCAHMAGSVLLGMVPAGILAFLRWLHAAERRRVQSGRKSRGHCPFCDYDLRQDLDGGCPECGWRRGPKGTAVH